MSGATYGELLSASEQHLIRAALSARNKLPDTEAATSIVLGHADLIRAIRANATNDDSATITVNLVLALSTSKSMGWPLFTHRNIESNWNTGKIMRIIRGGARWFFRGARHADVRI